MVDIYSKSPLDFDYDSARIDVYDELRQYYNSIINLLNTEVGEVLGGTDMPVDLEAYIFDIGLNTKNLQQLIIQKISQYCPLYRKFPTQVDVKFAQGEIRDICNIDFTINGERSMRFVIS